LCTKPINSFSHYDPVMACDGWTDALVHQPVAISIITMHMHWSCIVPQKRQKITYWEILIDCFHSTMIQVECRLQKKGWGCVSSGFSTFSVSQGSRHAHGSSWYTVLSATMLIASAGTPFECTRPKTKTKSQCFKTRSLKIKTKTKTQAFKTKTLKTFLVSRHLETKTQVSNHNPATDKL